MSEVESYISVGRIVRPHGIRGELKVVSLTGWPEHFNQYHSLYVERPDGKGKWFPVERSRLQGERVILKLSGVDNRERAESFRGSFLKIRKEESPVLPENFYYISELIGLEVYTSQGKRIGSVVDVMEMPAQDVYVVDIGEREILIPAVKFFVKRVDIKGGRILIQPIEGLLGEDEN